MAISVPRSLKSVSRHEKRALRRTGRARRAQRRDPARHPREVGAVGVAQARLEQPLLPPDDRVIFERRAAAATSGATQGSRALSAKPTQSSDVAEVERVSDQAKRPGRDQRPEPLASGPRDRADVVDGPQAQRFAGGDQQRRPATDSSASRRRRRPE